MLKLCLLVSLLCTPLLAVAPEAGASLALESAAAEITIAQKDDAVAVTITHNLTILNTGEAADFKLMLPDNHVPESLHESFMLKVGGAATKPVHDDGRFEWSVHVDGPTTVQWIITGGATRLPHVHALGRLELTVRLAHLRGYAALPENIAFTINHAGLAGKLFEREDDAPFTLQHPAGPRIQDFTLSWFESTLQDKRTELATTLNTFKGKQPNAENRLYTATLAHLVDLALLAKDDDSVATHCGTLAALEASSGKAITVCGPWAQWRRYVPWQLLRLRALEALGRDAGDCAKLAVAALAERWPAYLKARAHARPFDKFDAAMFGSYWDYDWTTTRELYARALEISGDADAAATVKGVED